ncbi:hypothetical protein OESDEN_08150 [Oesophagostomum dentatum]|uniref:Mediator of RNA polymerase II transcription subunit 10 n=1 Tax=Oesophagostomum dentatum TaxID=61180 RepID=A0A0B1T9B5_OESDE|nr:hypothetical protein OESDEN_08150 [Oesophagostomum dentatum]
MRNQFSDVKVPLELLDVLDQGKNPQLYTKEVLERTLQKNKEVNGKVETYKKFHAALLKELGEEMPEDTMTYRNIRDIMDKQENNPQIKYFLHRTYTECDPFVVGEYTWMRSRRKRVSWRSKHQVLSMVEEMAVGGDYRPGLKRGVNKRLPRGQELWDTETMGHDVFKVYSKWKADEDDLRMPTSDKHPHFVYRKY